MGASETTRELIVEPTASNARLDVFLRDRLSGLGRAAVRRLVAEGRVRIDGRRAAGSERLQAGQRVTVSGPVSTAALPDPSVPLALVYEDGACVVADKPAGMPSHPLAPGELGTLASALLARFPEMVHFGYSAREPGIVHRLDTDTSGLVLAARTAAAFEALRAQLEAGAIDKRYLALCLGVPEAQRVGVPLHAALVARGPRVHVRLERTAGLDLEQRELAQAGAQPIATEIVRVVSTHRSTAGELALLEIKAERARRHQVRAHLAALGHPIAGDARYGGPPTPQLARHFLHASALAFRHPITGDTIQLASALPEDLLAALRALSDAPR